MRGFEASTYDSIPYHHCASCLLPNAFLLAPSCGAADTLFTFHLPPAISAQPMARPLLPRHTPLLRRSLGCAMRKLLRAAESVSKRLDEYCIPTMGNHGFSHRPPVSKSEPPRQ